MIMSRTLPPLLTSDMTFSILQQTKLFRLFEILFKNVTWHFGGRPLPPAPPLSVTYYLNGPHPYTGFKVLEL